MLLASVWPSTYSIAMKPHSVAVANVVDRGDVRMIEGRRRTGLSHEPARALIVGRHVGRKDLQRHGPAQTAIDGAVHFAHPASPDG